MNQNLNYYKIFYEVAKTGNISKAAENLYISQPAVSKSITRLEQTLSHTLFHRSKKGVRLTEEGQTLFSHLARAFDSINQAEQELQQISQLGLGKIRIGASTSLCKHILLPYLQEFIKGHPHVKISIASNPTFETIKLLEEHKIDIGLICETPLPKDYAFLPLRSIHDTFVTTQTYLDNLLLREQETKPVTNASLESESTKMERKIESEYNLPSNMTGLFFFSEVQEPDWSGLPELTTKEILEKSNLMLMDKGNISRQYLEQYLFEQNIFPSQVLEINNMDLLIDFAAIGMGIACVVREFIQSYIETGQVMELSLEDAIPPRTVGLVYDPNSLNTSTKQLLELCKNN